MKQFIYDVAIHSLRKDITKLTVILKELKKIDGIGKTIKQLVRDIKDIENMIRTLKKNHGRKTWDKGVKKQ